MLYIIGLGLSDEKDITLKGLEAIKASERVYLESYTSILPHVSCESLSRFYEKDVIIADREVVESNSDEILRNAGSVNVSFLVVGDPFGATTHTDLVIRAREMNIPVEIIHNASILNVIGACGLQLYNFGQTVSLPFFTETWKPDSWYVRISENRKIGLHTLVLLDIKVKEQSLENLARARKIYEEPRYMTVSQAANQMLEIEDLRNEKVYSPDTMAIGVSRIGSRDQKIVYAALKELAQADIGPPLHSIVLPGSRCHEMEIQYLEAYRQH
ncbi:Diphthine methyl ester synthase [Neolecta irregularis DAH-3]|uniref:diphthine methyl ester synthase n=1 Tax=Neolecta irregularis (strain DAH-3) TaxID=1198029 RepID=A0A1U7LJI9_NEOID|nr:Diphthine methyl ester synthase [Neolecta irregularis DAH-3]|eukprot:OLL22809.1 Diphthine methyl ester synthase [Neolecta irregularis DAH-3]